MSEDLIRLVIGGIITLLIILLIYRIKLQIKRMIREEVYNNFPAIKDKIESFSSRLDYLKVQMEELERSISQLRKK